MKSLLVLSFFAVFYTEVEKRLKFFYFSDAFQREWLLGKCNRHLGINGTSNLFFLQLSFFAYLLFFPPLFRDFLPSFILILPVGQKET